jgi:hypothetical protein
MLQIPLLILVALLAASHGPDSAKLSEQEGCRASAGGAFSFLVRLSPGAGRACLDIVEVFAGPECAAERRVWSDTRGCSQTERVAVCDEGNLIAILAPATSHREWSIVLVLGWDGERVTEQWLSLQELPGTQALRGVVRPTFEGAAIRFSADVLVPFEAFESTRGS